jgi:transposase
MTLRSHPLPPIPEATMAAVQAAFPKGNLYVALRTELGILYDDQRFTDLYPPAGRPVEVAPWRLALVMVMQDIEGLTDRQAADTVRRCMDWQYALSLDLTDPGFDVTLWHDCRHRLLAHDGAQRLLDTFLAVCKARGGGSRHGARNAPIPRISWRRSARYTGWNASSKPCSTRSINSATWRSGCASRCRRHGTRATVSGPTRRACRRTPVNVRRLPARWARMAINSRTGSPAPKARQASLNSQRWKRYGGFGSNSMTAVPSQGGKRSAFRGAHRVPL